MRFFPCIAPTPAPCLLASSFMCQKQANKTRQLKFFFLSLPLFFVPFDQLFFTSAFFKNGNCLLLLFFFFVDILGIYVSLLHVSWQRRSSLKSKHSVQTFQEIYSPTIRVLLLLLSTILFLLHGLLACLPALAFCYQTAKTWALPSR